MKTISHASLSAALQEPACSQVCMQRRWNATGTALHCREILLPSPAISTMQAIRRHTSANGTWRQTATPVSAFTAKNLPFRKTGRVNTNTGVPPTALNSLHTDITAMFLTATEIRLISKATVPTALTILRLNILTDVIRKNRFLCSSANLNRIIRMTTTRLRATKKLLNSLRITLSPMIYHFLKETTKKNIPTTFQQSTGLTIMWADLWIN